MSYKDVSNLGMAIAMNNLRDCFYQVLNDGEETHDLRAKHFKYQITTVDKNTGEEYSKMSVVACNKLQAAFIAGQCSKPDDNLKYITFIDDATDLHWDINDECLRLMQVDKQRDIEKEIMNATDVKVASGDCGCPNCDTGKLKCERWTWYDKVAYDVYKCDICDELFKVNSKSYNAEKKKR